ncbi:MAG: hypothetical protein MEQ84_01710 [Mesorhizobium sp.]|nr:hypothetical protein [Mesorhizobium sp.]
MRQIVALLMLAGSALPALAEEPVDAVRPFYENIGMEYDDASLELFVDPARSVIEADRRMAEEGDLCLGFLLSVDAQDYDEAEIAQSLELSQDGDDERAEVTARFSNFGGNQTIIWRLVNQDGWKIADIGSAANDWWLSELGCD